MKIQFYLLIAGAAFVSSCSDDEKASLILAGEYRTGSSIMATNPVVMYTKNGRINNQQVINEFLRRPQLGLNDYFSPTDITIPSSSSLTLTISGTDRATLVLRGPAGSETIEAEITDRSAGYLVLANKDSVSSYAAGSLNRCAQLGEQLRTVVAGKRCRAVPPATGYSRFCAVRPVRVITIKDGKLFVPQFSWLVQAGQPSANTCTEAASGEWNTFNPAVINQLSTGDTLVLQEREIALLKQ